jgi:hypothetical protein
LSKTLLILYFSITTLNVAGQNSDPQIQNGMPYDKNYVIPVLDSLHNTNEYVLAFSISSPWRRSGFIILTKNPSGLAAYKYATKVQPGLIQLYFPVDTLNLLWKSYIDNDIFQLKNINTNNNCGNMIFDAHTYEYILLSKTRMKKLNFYAPEFFEENCSRVKEIKKVIASAAILSRALRRVINLVL